MVSKLEPVNIHDIDFVDELPTESICGICHFALKDPVQNADCGHRFCAVCFENFKEYSRKNSKKLLCPMDRSTIDSNHVYRDKAAERFILNQKVYCLNNTNGCIWSGEFRHHENHIERCNNKKHKDVDPLMETIEKQKILILNKEEELLRYEKDIKTKRDLIDALNKKILKHNQITQKHKKAMKEKVSIIERQKKDEILKLNQITQKHEEAMKEKVSIIERQKNEEFAPLLETVIKQEELMSNYKQKLKNYESILETKETCINDLKEKNCCLMKELEKERSTLFQKQMEISKHNQTIHKQQQQLEEMKYEVAWIEYQNNVEIRKRRAALLEKDETMQQLRKFKNSEGSLRMKLQSTWVENRQLKDQLFTLKVVLLIVVIYSLIMTLSSISMLVRSNDLQDKDTKLQNENSKLLNALNGAKNETKNLQDINSQLSNVLSDAKNENNRLSNALNGALKALKRIQIKSEEKVLLIIFINGVLALLIVYGHVLFF